ncbi:hypothetical protein [Nonomuraea typhae]|nr:hypothetical protein [Nonomuraea typhae]
MIDIVPHTLRQRACAPSREVHRINVPAVVLPRAPCGEQNEPE